MDDVKPFFLDLTEDEISTLESTFGRILRSGQLILNTYTEQFESEFAQRMGVPYAIATSSGTASLIMLLRAHDAMGKKVAVPTNTNFATAAAILHVGGMPVFMDMDCETFAPTLDMVKEAVERDGISGVIWVHIGGLISPEFPQVVEYCKSNNLFLIEDAAHAHGSQLGGVCAGAFADGGAFSFFPTKVMTTMEGGMVTTHDKDVADLMRSLRNQGKGASKFGSDHLHLGSSWRISEVAASIGLVQLGKLNQMLDVRSNAAKSMAKVLDEIGVPYCRFDHMDRSSQYKLIVRYQSDATIDEMKSRFKECGVILGGGVYDRTCDQQEVFKHVPMRDGGFPVAHVCCPRHICPPLTSGLTDSDVERVNNAMRKIFV